MQLLIAIFRSSYHKIDPKVLELVNTPDDSLLFLIKISLQFNHFTNNLILSQNGAIHIKQIIILGFF